MTLPTSTIVNVSIDRQTLFPQGPGFGTLLIVIPDTTLGSSGLSLANRVGTYTSIDGVAAHFASNTEVYKAASAYFAQNPRPTRLKLGVRDATPTGTFAAEMDAIVATDDDWYGVMLTGEARISADPAISAALAAWCEPRTKLFVTATNEAAALSGGGGLPATLRTSGYDRSGTIYHQDAANGASSPLTPYPEAALFGVMLTVDFNGVNTTKTAKFKRLRGINVSNLNSTQWEFLKANKGNAYVSVGGTSMFQDGTMASGEFFDTMHGIDWVSGEIQTRVFGKLVTLPKVPYTDAGMEILMNQVRLALQQGVNNGLFAPQFDADGNLLDAYEVSAPSVLTMSEANRSARIAPPISFVARLAGAVHYTQVNGTITI